MDGATTTGGPVTDATADLVVTRPGPDGYRHVTPEFRVASGDAALTALTADLERARVSRVVLVHGRSIDRHPDVRQRVEASLGERLVARFGHATEHSPLPVVLDAAHLLQDRAADGIVVLGGGSAVVTARAAAVLAAEQDDVRALCTQRDPGGRLHSPRLLAPKLPTWIVPSTPTTAVAKAGAAVRDPTTGERLALFDPKVRARGVYLDPAVLATAPPQLVVSAALNAFALALDGLLSHSGDPFADGLLAEALRLLCAELPLAGSDQPGSRTRLAAAAVLAGQGSDSTGTGLAQPLSHAVGPRSRVANGVVEAVLLPATLRFNAAVTDFSVLAGPLGLLHADEESVVQRVREVLTAAGAPASLRDTGVPEQELPQIVDHTLDDWSLGRVPRRVGREDLLDLLHAAW